MLQDQDVQVAQINQFYITGEEIFLYQIKNKSIEEIYSRTKYIYIVMDKNFS